MMFYTNHLLAFGVLVLMGARNVAEVTSSAGEQFHSIGQVGGAVEQLDQVTQQSAVLVE